MNEATVDALFQGKAYGTVAQRLQASGMNVNSLRTNTTLRKDEWKQYDTAVIKAAMQRLSGVADLMSRGLSYTITNGLGKTVLEYEDVSDMNDAEVSMDGVTRGPNDRVIFSMKYLPLPLIHKEFTLSARQLEASRTTGDPLDTTQAELCGRKVSEKLETILFQGLSSYSFGGGVIYGYQDFPYRNTISLGTAWTASSVTPASIVQKFLDAKQASINARHYGPWIAYIPTAYETVLDEDYNSTRGNTIRERILAIKGFVDVKVADYLSANNVVVVELTSETIRMVQGLKITVVEWSNGDGMQHHFKVMAIMVPQPRADQNNRCGIVHIA